MLAFIDESGEQGLKLNAGSSRFFVVGVVTFEGHREADDCDRRIAALRTDLSLPTDYEFHFSHNSRRVKESFLAAVTAFGFSFHIVGLNKAGIFSAVMPHQGTLYQWATRLAIESAGEHFSEATVILDKTGERRFRDELAAYLRKGINEGYRQRRIRNVKSWPSHEHNLLQLADYAVGVSAGMLRGEKHHVELHRRFLAEHGLSRRLWPEG